MRLIEEAQERPRVGGAQLDQLLAKGWRHFGTMFYRYNFAVLQGSLHAIIPLRLPAGDFQPSRSQRRVIRKNRDTSTVFRAAAITPVKQELFARHAQRFQENRPKTLYDFVSGQPQSVPCTCINVDVFLGQRLVATSFLDVGETAVSSIYAIYDPDFADRSLGIYTALEEIRFAREHGREFYYVGYATYGPSLYDYKKQIGAMWGYDWRGAWLPLNAWKL
jgi:arginine-tRNA-protein transferase